MIDRAVGGESGAGQVWITDLLDYELDHMLRGIFDHFS